MTDIKVVEMELYHLLCIVNRQDMESKFNGKSCQLGAYALQRAAEGTCAVRDFFMRSSGRKQKQGGTEEKDIRGAWTRKKVYL